MRYTDIVKIDLSKLHVECQQQSSNYLEVCDLLADANKYKDKCKNYLEYIYSDLNIKVLSRWNKYFDSKPSVDAIKAWIFKHRKYIKAQKELLEATRKVNQLTGVRSSLDHKKKALELIISLYNSGYWSEPHLKGEVINNRTKERRKKAGKKVLNKKHKR